jgi:NAD(P)-dependent dehydrogenase (short-subunit alcohol dehydrogenase family)
MSSPLEKMFGVSGKIARVTGASRGIGRAMAEALADAGCRLVIASDEADACSQQVQKLTERGIEAFPFVVDVRVEAQLDALLAATLNQFGGLDILICNAGVPGHVGPLSDVKATVRDDTFAVNLFHPLHLAKLAAPHIAARGGGSIILMSSIAGLRGNSRLGLYGMTKAALSQLARDLAVEWGPHAVRVNAIAPGLIRTAWADAVLHDPEATSRRMQQTPLRRIGEPWEVAALALFLAGPGSAFITGQTLVIDGGTLISDGS